MKNQGEKNGNYKHGLSTTQVYRIWRGMLQRCNNPNDKSYHHYGGRGITVCAEWTADFLRFRSDMGERPRGYSLGRVDNDGNYEPGNCAWETRTQQNNNKRVNRRLTALGRTLTVAQWSREYGVREDTIKRRLILGWSVADAVSVPTGSRRGRGRPRKALCRNGHPMTEYPHGQRYCRVCREERERRQRAK